MMIRDEVTNKRRPLNKNERFGLVVIFLMIFAVAASGFYLIVTGEVSGPTKQIRIQPTPRVIIQRVGREGIPLEVPIEFYTDRGSVKWREIISP